MKSLQEYIASKLNENLVKTKLRGKNVLFHATTSNGFDWILTDDKINGASAQMRNSKYDKNRDYGNSQIKGISLTRNWNLNFNDGTAQFILDADKLKRKFGKKLAPIDYFGNDNYWNEEDFDGYLEFKPKWNPTRPKKTLESEEFLETDALYNLHEYVLGFIINDRFYKSHEVPKVMFNDIKEYVEKHKLKNIYVYWQNGDLIAEL